MDASFPYLAGRRGRASPLAAGLLSVGLAMPGFSLPGFSMPGFGSARSASAAQAPRSVDGSPDLAIEGPLLLPGDVLPFRSPGLDDEHGKASVAILVAVRARDGAEAWSGEVVVTVPWDRWWAPRSARPGAPRLGASLSPLSLAVAPGAEGAAATSAPTASRVSSPEREGPPAFDGALARDTVAAALRAAGLSRSAARWEALAARARLAAALPETRLRVLRTQDQSARVDGVPEDRRTTDTLGNELWLEARLGWRLDRLVFADEEVQLERLRMDEREAEAKVTAKVIDWLLRHARARVELAHALEGSLEAQEAALHLAEAELVLDVLTAGWFAHRRPPAPIPQRTAEPSARAP